MRLKEELINEENIELKDKVNIINKEIDKCDKTIKDYKRTDINTYKKIDEFEFSRAIKEKNIYDDIKNKPYFGRLDIYYKDENEKVKIYIGKRDLILDDTPHIVSWAAPIADVYERFNNGKFDYEYKNKNGTSMILNGNIKEKRRIVIEDGKVKDVYSFMNGKTEESEEKFIIEKILNSETEKLGSIVETIQENQNEIVRLPIEKNILVQGCAGSGKSSVAFHRLAYLAYNYELNKDELLVISPNKIFQGYTSDILTELGSKFEAQQYTFNEFVEKKLDIKIKEKSSILDVKELARMSLIKTSKSFKELLDKYYIYIEDNYIPKGDIIINNHKLINYDEINGIWKKEFSIYKINDRITKFKQYLEQKLNDKLSEILENIEVEYKREHDLLKKYSSESNYYEICNLLKAEKDIKVKRINQEIKMLIFNYINNLKEVDIFRKYYELIRSPELLLEIGRQIELLKDNDLNFLINKVNQNDIVTIDYIPLIYFYYKVNENKNKYRHIVIDECQDLSYIELATLEGLTKSFTLVGDFNQRIKLNKSNVTIEEIEEMFKSYTYFNVYYLNKSFRNFKEITNYSNEILMNYFKNKSYIPEAFNRSANKPKVYFNIKKEQIILKIKNNINSIINKSSNIAIIFKEEKDAIYYYKEYITNNNLSVNLIDNEECNYKKGINFLTPRLSKGLEFDYVIIADGNKYLDNEEDRRLLYIAVTRALRGIEIYGEDKNCFINNIDKNLWEEGKDCIDNILEKGLKDNVINYLKAIFGELDLKYKDYIYNYVEYDKIIEVLRKIHQVKSIDEVLLELGIKSNEKDTDNKKNNKIIRVPVNDIYEGFSSCEYAKKYISSNKISIISKFKIVMINKEFYIVGISGTQKLICIGKEKVWHRDLRGYLLENKSDKYIPEYRIDNIQNSSWSNKLYKDFIESGNDVRMYKFIDNNLVLDSDDYTCYYTALINTFINVFYTKEDFVEYKRYCGSVYDVLKEKVLNYNYYETKVVAINPFRNQVIIDQEGKKLLGRYKAITSEYYDYKNNSKKNRISDFLIDIARLEEMETIIYYKDINK